MVTVKPAAMQCSVSSPEQKGQKPTQNYVTLCLSLSFWCGASGSRVKLQLFADGSLPLTFIISFARNEMAKERSRSIAASILLLLLPQDQAG